MIRGLSAVDMLRARGVAGLGVGQDDKDEAFRRLGILDAAVEQAKALFPKYKARLKADKNWWADNFDAKIKEYEEFKLDVQARSPYTLLPTWSSVLERLTRDADGFIKIRDVMREYERKGSSAPAQKPPSSSGASKPPPSSGAATTDLAPPPEAAAEGESNTMMYVGIGVAALLILMAFSSKE